MTAEKLSQNNREYSFKTNRIERVISIISIVFFVFTFVYPKNIILMIGFYAYASVILLYYFVWFRKKPPYVEFSDNEVVVRLGLFFKPVSISRGRIKEIKKTSPGLIIKLLSGSKVRVIKIFSLLAGENEINEIAEQLSGFLN